jgi:hypothetical protein
LRLKGTKQNAAVYFMEAFPSLKIKAVPAAFTLIKGIVTPGGVIIAHYKRAGKVKTGTSGS